MEEIEVKILEVNRQDVESKLISMGARKTSEEEVLTIFFDNDKNQIKENEETFRLRKIGKKTFLTHKKKLPSEEAKIRDEKEVEVSDFEETKRIINSIGFEEVKKTKKKRISYNLGGTKFEFDKYSEDLQFIPEFLEIESSSTKDIYKFVELLGFSKNDCKSWTTKNLIKHYS